MDHLSHDVPEITEILQGLVREPKQERTSEAAPWSPGLTAAHAIPHLGTVKH